jgi:hypothetical protein
MDLEDGGAYGSPAALSPLKLLAIEALADPGFHDKLKNDPEAAVLALGLKLSEDQIEYLRDGIHWAVDAHVDEMRQALHVEPAQASW